MNESVSPKKVLIIDDDEALVVALAEKLRAAGYEVFVAGDGKAGIEKAYAVHPDVTVLDVVMPEMDGWGVITALRLDEWGKTARVVMLTNADDAESVSKAVEHGTTQYLIKGSWTLDDVVAKVGAMLS